MLKKTNPWMREANLIDGRWVGADEGGVIEVNDPATRAIIGTVPDAGEAETRRAIDAASEAFETFSRTAANERAAILRRMQQIMLDRVDELAELLTLEQGKPLAEAKGEITIGANYIGWFAEEARRIEGRTVESPWGDRRIMVLREPVGVVGAITPWNFPSSMLARKIGPAIAAGCTSVVKPSEFTPYSGLAWGLIAEEAGLPEGVINIVTGDAAAIGKALTDDPRVAKITFTGSTRVGRLLLSQSGATVKRVSMELGGNAPFLVFDDADLDRAVEGAMAAKYRNSGQTCVCTNRFYVQAGVYDAFTEKLAEKAKALKVGNGFEGAEQGPLINEAALAKVEGLVADAKGQGADIVAGGARHELGGTFYQPTVIAGATQDMRITREEVFGPVAAVYRFDDEDEAVQLANDTEYGLAAYFYTNDLGRTFRVMRGLRYGLVGVNEGIITTPEAPFGGVKQSGLGSEGGREGIGEYLDTKYVCIGGLGE